MKTRYTWIALIIGVVYAIASIIVFFINNDLLLAGELGNPITILMYPALFLGVLPSYWIISSFDCHYPKDCLGATAFATPFLTIISFLIIGLLVDFILHKFYRKSNK